MRVSYTHPGCPVKHRRRDTAEFCPRGYHGEELRQFQARRRRAWWVALLICLPIVAVFLPYTWRRVRHPVLRALVLVYAICGLVGVPAIVVHVMPVLVGVIVLAFFVKVLL